MPDQYDDERLESVLRSIGAHLELGADVEPVGEMEGTEGAEVTTLRRRSMRRRPLTWLAAAAAVLLVAVLVGVATPVGETVADWFGVGDVEVRFVAPGEGTPTDEPLFIDPVRPIDPVAAWERAVLDPGTFDTSRLGPPELYGVPPEGGVVFGWRDHESSLWVLPVADDVGPTIKKLVPDRSRLESVPGLGEDAVFIDGPHVLTTPARRVAADRVLWWIKGDTEYRLESTLARDAMIETARLVD